MSDDINAGNSIPESEYISVSPGSHVNSQLREARRENKFIKIANWDYLDLVLYPNDKERNKTIDGMFNKLPTGRKKNLFLTHEVFLDDTVLQQFEVSMKSGTTINEYLRRMKQDVCPVRVFREGTGTDTKYWVKPLRLVENEVSSTS